jgi:flavin-dependent dehydrogenase
MNAETTYDIAIIGGGLAGLSAAIQLSKKQHRVILFEKEQYPFHRVCGEYISMESFGFLERLGLPLSTMNLPIISRLIVTAPSGFALKQALPLGGFGISRFMLDDKLKDIALQSGVTVMQNCKVEDVSFNNDAFQVSTSNGLYHAKVCCGTFGKRSNIDVRWKRNFVTQPPNKLNNYVGIKYHVETDFPLDTIALHNFNNGYCGISAVENSKYCLCYLTTAANLQASGNSIDQLEKNILSKNPELKKIFSTAKKTVGPTTISQISFQQKSIVENHVLMLGDAAGMITPLCGNGMSMALHGSRIATENIQQFLENKISRSEMESIYSTQWKQQFARRLKTGRIIQGLFGKPATTNLFVKTAALFPSLTRWLIKQTHGQPF